MKKLSILFLLLLMVTTTTVPALAADFTAAEYSARETAKSCVEIKKHRKCKPTHKYECNCNQSKQLNVMKFTKGCCNEKNVKGKCPRLFPNHKKVWNHKVVREPMSL